MSPQAIGVSPQGCWAHTDGQCMKHTTYLFADVLVKTIGHALEELGVLLMSVRMPLLSSVLLLLLVLSLVLVVLVVLILLVLVVLLLILLLLLIILLAFAWVHQSFVRLHDFNKSAPK